MSYKNDLPEKRSLKKVNLLGGDKVYILENVNVLEAQTFFGAKNLETITASQFAKARLQSHLCCEYGTFVAESSVHLLNGDMLVVGKKYSPFLKQTSAMALCHKEGKELPIHDEHTFVLTDLAEENIEKAVETGVLYVARENIRNIIRPEDFGNYSVTQFLFREVAKKYGSFLKLHGFPFVNHSTPTLQYIKQQEEQQELPFCCPLWIHPLRKKFDMCAYSDIVANTTIAYTDIIVNITMIGYKAKEGKQKQLKVPAVKDKEFLQDLEIPPDIVLDDSPPESKSPKSHITVPEYFPVYRKKRKKKPELPDKAIR